MRRLTLFVLAGAALLAAPLAEASVLNTAHDTNAQASGTCSACHFPHGVQGARLWPVSPSTALGGNLVGVVATLCGSCHEANGAYKDTMSAAFSDNYAYGNLSHGVLMSGANPPWGTAISSSGLPYTNPMSTGSIIECTSCHDVHEDTATRRPFLRDSIDALCARCHTNRHFVNNALSQGGTVNPGTWGTANVGLANPGSHPVGSDITGDVSGGGSVISIVTAMSVPTNNIKGGWSLGGHRYGGTAAGGVTCVTCHAVHGVQKDAQDTGWAGTVTADTPNANFLTVDQGSGMTLSIGAGTRTVSNGHLQTNTLCEACHGGTGNNPATNPAGGAFSSTYAVNPGGASTFSHPVDNYPSSIQAGVASFGTNWPTGPSWTTVTNVSPIPICESCHMPHPLADDARADNNWSSPTDTDYILRASAASVCNVCHTSTPDGHHPVGMAYNNSGVPYLTNAAATLTCSTCHSGSGGAHNWAQASYVAISAGWIPANNGRSTDQATDMYNANMSKTCMDCHYAMDGNAASVSPTLGVSATSVVGLEPEFQTLTQSMGTHYIGLIHGAATNWVASPAVNMYDTTRTWHAQNAKYAAGWSRFGGDSTARVIVCETCHELQPKRNVGGGIDKHLLLGPSGEGRNGDDQAATYWDGSAFAALPADTDGRDSFCEACHGVPPGTHALTGQTVSKTGVVLETDRNTTIGGNIRSWLRATLLGNATWGTDKVSCDSCHQVHDANSASYTFILDAPLSDGVITSMVGAGTLETTNPAATPAYPSGTYATPTLQGRGGSYTGYCDQCHTYAY